MKQIFLIIALSFFTLFIIGSLTPNELMARPGGGHSYSNGSSSGGSSSGGNYSSGSSSNTDYSQEKVTVEDIIAPIVFAFFLGFMFAIVFIFVRIIKKIKKVSVRRKATKNLTKFKEDIIKIKKTDPNFSETLFLDFASSFFIKYHSWFGKDEFTKLTPYITKGEIETSKKYQHDIKEIVIGSINILNISLSAETQKILVEIDANFTTFPKNNNGSPIRIATLKKFQFSRNAGILSPEPDKIRDVSCPSCGASANFTDTGNCESCGTFIRSGEMQWYLSEEVIIKTNHFKTTGLAHYAAEKGTKDRTIFQPNLKSDTAEFARNNNLNYNQWYGNFTTKVANEYFKNIYQAWSENNLSNVRNLLSDRLHTSWLFWLANYKREGLTNKLDNVSIKKTELVKINTDKFYEAITVRIHASCKDYVTNKDSKVVGGSKKKARKFSEYWTFVRRAGVKKDDYNYKTCPNCGAPADKMGQAGICEYCNTKISNGDFSWVLSIITQDEVYKG